MSKTPQEYCDLVLGKRFDEDKKYGVQCVDGFKHFCRTQCNFDISNKTICSPTNLATSIWDNFYSLGLDKYFDQVPWDAMEDGDWAIWSIGSRSCPDSHIAMFRRDNNAGKGIFLGQNQLNHPEYTQINIYYDGLRGGLRPKIYHQKESSNLYITKGTMYLRREPNLNSNHILVKEMSEDGKVHATSTNPNAWAIYKVGTKFNVYEYSKNNDGRLWGKTPSGWIVLKGSSGVIYCEEIKD